jgi:hypothetical protein
MHSSHVSTLSPHGDLHFGLGGDTAGEGRHSEIALDRG